MKKLNTKVKLIIAFSVMAALSLAVGLVGIFSMNGMRVRESQMFKYIPAIRMLGTAAEEVQRINADLHKLAIASPNGISSEIESIIAQIDRHMLAIQGDLDNYAAGISGQPRYSNFFAAKKLYDSDFAKYVENVKTAARRGESTAAINRIMNAEQGALEMLSARLDFAASDNLDWCHDERYANDIISLFSRILQAVLTAVAFLAAVFFAFHLNKLISSPISLLTKFMEKAGSTGVLSLGAEEDNALKGYGAVKNDIGACFAACIKFIDRIVYTSNVLKRVAEGDLTVDVVTLSDGDTMGVSLSHVVDNLDSMFAEIHSATGQVSTGAGQIADGASLLAQRSVEQASTTQQLSAAVTEISGTTAGNLALAEQAVGLSGGMMQKAEKGSRQMEDMMVAVDAINHSSQDISKVMKVIDDIAFQTNILALNAAVEAARAGQHGKGFAIVADEVRNLASKSAEASRDSGVMITSSMEKAELGARIARETASSLAEIVSGIDESKAIIDKIAQSSHSQVDSLKQINTSIEQVASVVQQNSTTAEQSAAASEELNSQAEMLEQLVARFKLKGGGAHLPPYGKPRSGFAL